MSDWMILPAPLQARPAARWTVRTGRAVTLPESANSGHRERGRETNRKWKMAKAQTENRPRNDLLSLYESSFGAGGGRREKQGSSNSLRPQRVTGKKHMCDISLQEELQTTGQVLEWGGGCAGKQSCSVSGDSRGGRPGVPVFLGGHMFY